MEQSVNPVFYQKELKGLGGWLVLFQIYIILCVVSALNSAVIIAFLGNMTVLPSFRPVYIALLSAAFAAALACMILFYCKRIVFRPVFVAYAVIALVSTTLYTFVGADYSIYTTLYGEYGRFFVPALRAISYVSLVIGGGLMLAIIIALYKSQRVKNTFMKLKEE